MATHRKILGRHGHVAHDVEGRRLTHVRHAHDARLHVIASAAEDHWLCWSLILLPAATRMLRTTCVSTAGTRRRRLARLRSERQNTWAPLLLGTVDHGSESRCDRRRAPMPRGFAHHRGTPYQVVYKVGYLYEKGNSRERKRFKRGFLSDCVGFPTPTPPCISKR